MDVVEEFQNKEIEVEHEDTGQTLDMSLPETLNDAFRYVAKLSLLDNKAVKLVPLTSLQRLFVRCDRTAVQCGAFGEKYVNCLSIHHSILTVTHLAREYFK